MILNPDFTFFMAKQLNFFRRKIFPNYQPQAETYIGSIERFCYNEVGTGTN
jgi:hypothetical protein